MNKQDFLVEMLIIGILGLFSIAFCTLLLIKSLQEKDWEKFKPFFLATDLFIGVSTLFFEILWFCMYLGIPV